MTRRASALSGATVACVALLLGAGCDASGDATIADAPGKREVAPDFSFTDLDGQQVRLSELKGRTVIIDFWATWCPPCVFQPPELNAFWERHRESGKVAVLGIEVGGASIEEIREWAADNDAVAKYPILTGADEDLARRFGALGFPALVIVTPDGTIDSVHVGLTSVAELEEQVAAVEGAPAAS